MQKYIMLFNFCSKKLLLCDKKMMKRTTISLSDEDFKQLKELANKELRPISSQIIYMMRYYIDNK